MASPCCVGRASLSLMCSPWVVWRQGPLWADGHLCSAAEDLQGDRRYVWTVAQVPLSFSLWTSHSPCPFISPPLSLSRSHLHLLSTRVTFLAAAEITEVAHASSHSLSLSSHPPFPSPTSSQPVCLWSLHFSSVPRGFFDRHLCAAVRTSSERQSENGIPN